MQFSEGNVKLTKIIIIKYLGQKFGKKGRKALSFKTHCSATSMHHRIPFWVGTTIPNSSLSMYDLISATNNDEVYFVGSPANFVAN